MAPGWTSHVPLHGAAPEGPALDLEMDPYFFLFELLRLEQGPEGKEFLERNFFFFSGG